MLATIEWPMAGREAVQDALDALTLLNRRWLARHPGTPSIYEVDGLQYTAERGTEIWQSLPLLLRSGRGDCEDLSCALAAATGGRAVCIRTAAGYHVLVLYRDGSVEDPSIRLGMRGPNLERGPR